MKRILTLIFTAAILLCSAAVSKAQEQEPNMDEVITAQLENITRMFKLDEVQAFFVDSVLQYNFPAMMEEMQQVRKTGASNADTYQSISDKWMDATDTAFEKIFTKEQWAKYMKSSYGKEKKRRDKRISERGGILPGLTSQEPSASPQRQ